MKQLSPPLLGLAAAVVVCVVVSQLPSRHGLEFFALFLAATAAVYIGSALSAGRRGVIFLETVIGLAIFATALAGLWYSSALLAVGYVAHGAWDFFHHPHRAGAEAGKSFPPLCWAYDWVVGAFILFRY